MIREVSKRYARALYESAKEAKKSDLVLSELRVLKQAITADKGILEFTESPLVSSEKKAEFIQKSLASKLSPEMVNFMVLLSNKGRLALYSEIAQAFEAIIDEDNGVTRGTVRSAAPLSADERKRIEETVTKVTKKKVILSFTEDPKLLGGMVAQVGGWNFDDCLESHLNRLGEDLKRRAN